MVLGVLVLLVGPLAGRLIMRSHSAAAAMFGFIMTTVTGLVLLHILPQSIERYGHIGTVLVVFGVGLLAPLALHRVDVQAGTTKLTATIVIMVGAFAHAMFDGAALADHGDGPILAVAVILHRVPYALAIWIVGRERLGTPHAIALLSALALGTLAGGLWASLAHNENLVLLQTFTAGAVLHVLFEAPIVDVRASLRPVIAGAVAGALTVASVLLV